MQKKKYFHYFLQGGRIRFGVSLVASVIEAILAAGMGIALQKMLDVAAYGSLRELYQCIVAIVTYFITMFCVCMVVRSTKQHFIEKAIVAYKERVLRGIFEKTIHTFDSELTGKYVSMLTNDIRVIEEKYLEKVYSLLSGVVTLIAAIGIMLMYDAGMFGVTIAMCFVTMLIASLVGKDLGRIQEKVSKEDGKQSGLLQEMFTGFAVIKSFQAEKEMSALFTKQNRSTEEVRCKRRMVESLVHIVAMALVTGSQVVIMAFGAWLVMQGTLTVGVLVAFIQLMNSIMNPAQTIPADLSNMAAARQIMKQHDMFWESQKEKNMQTDTMEEYQLNLQNVSFAYEENKPILHNINVSFEQGKSYAIVGASGSGKSTLLKLLAGELGNYGGRILVGNREYEELDFSAICSMVTFIRQKNFLFDSSIENNISMFKKFPKESIAKAIELAGLQEVFVKKEADFTCGENGNRLSGGEGQRVAIARGILRGTPILLLDEVTASLDVKTARQVEASLAELKGCTRIAVSHKLHSNILSKYNCILAMKDGKIEESGSFDELMEKKGYFYSLYQIGQA